LNSIAIIGCGPAGLAAAIALHDIGEQVCLFEQFDQPGPVGSGLMLQPTGLEVLARWGLRASVENLGQRIDGMLGRIAPDGKVVLDINYNVLSSHRSNIKSNGNNELYGVAIHRASLFYVLYEAAKERNISILTSTRIASYSQDATKSQTKAMRLFDSNGVMLDDKFDLIVDSSGAQSMIAQRSSLAAGSKTLSYGALWTTVEFNEQHFKSNLLEQRYDKASVMVGVLPCGKLPYKNVELATLFWSIRTDQMAALKSAGLDAWKDSVVQHWPTAHHLLENIEDLEQLTHATYSHHTLKQPFAPGIVFIGDAAHATSPQLGQGANMALLDAYALAQSLKLTKNVDQCGSLYARMRRTHVKLFQAASYTLTPFYQSDSRLLPQLRDTFFEPVSKIPFVRKMVTSLGSGLLTDPIKTIDKIARQKHKRQ